MFKNKKNMRVGLIIIAIQLCTVQVVAEETKDLHQKLQLSCTTPIPF